MTMPRMTGALTTSARKIVRRDHSICPRLRSNTRNAAVANDGICRAAAGAGEGAGPAAAGPGPSGRCDGAS